MGTPDETATPVAQEGQRLFERNVAHIARARREVVVVLDTGDEITGFLAGMDQRWIELYVSADDERSLIARDRVVELTETKNTPEDYPDEQTRINANIRHFVKICEAALARAR